MLPKSPSHCRKYVICPRNLPSSATWQQRAAHSTAYRNASAGLGGHVTGCTYVTIKNHEPGTLRDKPLFDGGCVTCGLVSDQHTRGTRDEPGRDGTGRDGSGSGETNASMWVSSRNVQQQCCCFCCCNHYLVAISQPDLLLQ